MVGDPILFKVSKKFHDGLEDATAYEVLDVCYDPSLVGMFISQYLTTKSTKVSVLFSFLFIVILFFFSIHAWC